MHVLVLIIIYMEIIIGCISSIHYYIRIQYDSSSREGEDRCLLANKCEFCVASHPRAPRHGRPVTASHTDNSPSDLRRATHTTPEQPTPSTE